MVMIQTEMPRFCMARENMKIHNAMIYQGMIGKEA